MELNSERKSGDGFDLNSDNAGSVSNNNNENNNGDRDHKRSRSRSPEKDRRSRSRSPQKDRKSRSKSPRDRDRKKSRSRSRSPRRDRDRKSRSRSPRRDRDRRSRSRSPKKSRRHSRDRSPERRRRRSPERSYRYNDKNRAPSPNSVLGVFGLNVETKEQDIEDLCSACGRVDKVYIVYDKQTGYSKCYGFVYMRSISEANEVMKRYSGYNLHGKPIRFDYSTTKRAHDPTPGQYMGSRRRESRRDSYRSSSRRSRSRSRSRDRRDRR